MATRVDSGSSGFFGFSREAQPPARIRAGGMTPSCPPFVRVQRQTATSDVLADGIGDGEGGRWRERSNSETNEYDNGDGTVTTEIISNTLKQLDIRLGVTQITAFSNNTSRPDENFTFSEDCPDGSGGTVSTELDGTRSWLWNLETLSAVILGVSSILFRRHTLRRKTEREQCDGSVDVDYDFWDRGSGGFSSSNPVFTGEITKQDDAVLRAEALDQMQSFWPDDGELWLNNVAFSWLDEASYYDTENEEPFDEDTGDFGSIGDIVFDQSQFDDALANYVQFTQDDIDDLDNDIADKEQQIQDKQAEIDARKQAIADAITQYDSDKSEFDSANDTVWQKLVAWRNLKHRLIPPTGLSDADEQDLQTQADSAKTEYDDAVAARPTRPLSAPEREETDQQLTFLENDKRKLEETLSAFNAERESLVWQRDQRQANNIHPDMDSFIGGGSQLAEREDGLEKRRGRYRMALDVRGAYDPTRPVTVTVEWEEHRVVTLGDGSTEETFTPMSEEITIDFSAPVVYGEWHTPALADEGATPADNVTVDIAGPRSDSASVTSQTFAMEARKRGVLGYLAASPPPVYRREEFSGGFPGCEEKGLESKDYSGTREAFDFFDRFDLSADARKVLEEDQFQPVSRALISSDPVGSRFPGAFDESMTRRAYLRKTIQCGDSELLDEMIGELKEEITTDEIKAQVDDYVDDFAAGGSPSFPPDAGGVRDDFLDYGSPAWKNAESPVAYRILSDDEIVYARNLVRVTVSESDGDETSVTIKADKRTYETGSGNLSSVEVTGTSETDASGSVTPAEFELDPEEGKIQWLENIRRDPPEKQEFGDPEITAVEPAG